MAEFNPTAGQSPQAPNFTGASRGIRHDRIQPDTSVADLFEGLGEGLMLGVEAVDQGIQAEIQDDVNEGMDQIHAEFGLDSAADFETDIFGGNPVPEQLRDSARHLEGLQAARASGQLKESHYWARAQSLVRQLRGRYPGYREQIDTMIEGVTGAPVANSLRRSLMREWGEGAGDNEKRRLNQVEEMAKDGSLLIAFPDYYERAAAGNEPSYPELVAGQAEWMQEEALINRGQARLAAQEASGNLVQAEALRTFREEAFSQRDRVLQQAMVKAEGESGVSVMERVQELQRARQKGTPTSLEEAQQVAAAFENMRIEMGKVFDSLLAKQWADSDSPTATYRASLSSEDIEAARKEFMRPVERLEQAIKDKDTGTLNNFALAMEGRKLKLQNDIIQNNPGIEFSTSMAEILGSDLTAAVIANEPRLKTTIAELSRRVMLNNLMLGDPDDPENFPSMKQDFETIAGDDKISDSDATEITKGTIQSFVNAVETIGTEDELPADILEKYVEYMFSERNFGALDSLSIDARKQFLSRVSSPRVTEKMMELRDNGNKDAWDKYQKWTAHQFKALFRGDIASIQDRILNPELFDIEWNPKDLRFEVVENPDMSPVTRRNITESGEVGQIKKARDSINKAIQTIAPVIEANDMDPAEQIMLLMREMGLNPEADPEEVTVAGAMLNALQRQFLLGAEDVRQGDLPLIGKRGAERLGANVSDATEGIRQSFWELVAPFSPQYRSPEVRRGIIQGAQAATPDAATVSVDNGRFISKGLKIEHRFSETSPYGKTATQNAQPPKYLVMHHAVGDTDNLVDYGHKVDEKRGGAFGYHFYISPSGRVVQGAPLSVRTNHVKPPSSGARVDGTEASNSNSLGISLVNAHEGATVAQMAAAEHLANQLAQQYNIPLENFLGHGELQSDRMSTEGQQILERIRTVGLKNLPLEDRIFLLEEALENGNIAPTSINHPLLSKVGNNG